jgi:hypothetical protein
MGKMHLKNRLHLGVQNTCVVGVGLVVGCTYNQSDTRIFNNIEVSNMSKQSIIPSTHPVKIHVKVMCLHSPLLCC